MNWFGLIKFVTGVFLAIAILFVAGAATARYFITRLTAPPPKPVFSEELATSDPPPEESVTAEPAPPEAPPEASPEPEPEPLEPGAYEARIVQPIGMVLRQGPSVDTTRIGGIDYNQMIVVLGESSDGRWQQVRLPGSGVEGWIKAGNIERLN